MKKVLVLLLAVMLLAGCNSADSETVRGEAETVDGETVDSEVDSAVEVTTVSIDDAFTMNEPVKCTVNMDDGKAFVWIKGDKQKMELEMNGQKVYSIFTTEYAYTWGTGQAMKINVQEMKELAGQYPDQNMQTEVTADSVKQYSEDIKCEKASFGDDMFVPPSDVEFQDMMEALKMMLG